MRQRQAALQARMRAQQSAAAAAMAAAASDSDEEAVNDAAGQRPQPMDELPDAVPGASGSAAAVATEPVALADLPGECAICCDGCSEPLGPLGWLAHVQESDFTAETHA